MNGLDALAQALARVRSEDAPVAELCAAARAQGSLLAQLPPRYGEVLEELLQRLEASALFSEESCSFSRRDLLDAVQAWIDRARIRASA